MDLSFVDEVTAGLEATPKFLSSKYFYDDRGSKLFQQIMALPEYYLTRCEFEIMEQHKVQMLNRFLGKQGSFDLLEFGAGDGLKTKVLLRHFLAANSDFRYMPIDISRSALQELESGIREEMPALPIEPLHNDYFGALRSLDQSTHRKRVVLFMGSNIGNFRDDEAAGFLSELRENLNPGDQVLIGFDLRKDPEVILAAYNDSQGVTRDFNLNLLTRMNRELDADFDLDGFEHRPVYDPDSGEARSYVVSTRDQTVTIGAANRSFHFADQEAIHTEISRKYSPEQIQTLADRSGYRIVETFTDSQNYFADVLWEAL